MRTRQAWGMWAEQVLLGRAADAGEQRVAMAPDPGSARKDEGRKRSHLGAGAICGGALVVAALVFAVAVAIADPLNDGSADAAASISGGAPLADMAGKTDADALADEAPDTAAEADGEGGVRSGAEKPYSELTPVDSPDNTVNTHQQPDSSFLYDTSLVDVARADTYMDGETVQIVGEVIGDIIKEGVDGTHVWVTLTATDESSDETVVVYMTTDQASIIDTLGGYGRTGTILQVRGVFHLACSDHQGLSDIHVENANVVNAGKHDPDVFAWRDFVPGIVGFAIAGALLLVFHLLRQRLR